MRWETGDILSASMERWPSPRLSALPWREHAAVGAQDGLIAGLLFPSRNIPNRPAHHRPAICTRGGGEEGEERFVDLCS